MRQSKREITDQTDLENLLQQCQVTRLGLSDGNQPYIVPMNYGFEFSNGRLFLYFHCAREGRKLDIIAVNNLACFEIDCEHNLHTGEHACQYSMNYASIVGSGTLSIVSDSQERLHGLNILMQHYSNRSDWPFDQKALSLTTILGLDVAQYTGKRLRK